MKFWKRTIALIALISVGGLLAQPRLVNREEEKTEFPDLQNTEARQEKNIQDAYQRLRSMGFLVKMTNQDRELKAKEDEEPLNFDYTYRYVKFTPHNTYIRYVAAEQQFLLNTFGAQEAVKKLIDDRVAKAKEIKAWGEGSQEVAFSAEKKGVELTQFEFIYNDDEEGVRKAIGSRRKSVSLFFDQAGTDIPQGTELTLNMVVTRIVEDNFRHGIRDTQLIIDPSPNTPLMDDVIILHRYNEKPTSITVLGMMSNTSTNPHRTRFKQKFYIKLLDHFFRLYRMVANYASKDDNDYNESVLEQLEHSMNY